MGGGLVAEGAGTGMFAGATLRVGSGNGGALRLLLPFELVFALLFSLAFASGVTSSIGVASSTAFAFGEAFAFAFADGLTAPPCGSPSSAFPVGG